LKSEQQRKPFTTAILAAWTTFFWYFIEKQYFADPHHITSFVQMAGLSDPRARPDYFSTKLFVK
jgi:hypothetical protein